MDELNVGQKMNAIIANWLPDVVDDNIVVSPEDVCAEARENYWTFSVTSEEAESLTTNDIETFISTVVGARRDALQQRNVMRGTMTFYCWFDEMSSLLCFSIVSAKRDALPFGCDLVDALLPCIASVFLGSRFHDGIPWSEFRPVESLSDDPPKLIMPVWSVAIP